MWYSRAICPAEYEKGIYHMGTVFRCVYWIIEWKSKYPRLSIIRNLYYATGRFDLMIAAKRRLSQSYHSGGQEAIIPWHGEYSLCRQPAYSVQDIEGFVGNAIFK